MKLCALAFTLLLLGASGFATHQAYTKATSWEALGIGLILFAHLVGACLLTAIFLDREDIK